VTEATRPAAAGIEHHETEKEEQAGEEVFPVADDPVGFVVLKEEQRDGGDEAGGCRDGEAGEVLGAVGWVGLGGERIKTGQTHGPADKINERNHPADTGGKLGQHDLEDEQGRGDAEGNDIGKGIKLPAKGAFLAAEAGEAAVKHVENQGPQNPEQAGFVGGDPVAVFRRLHEAALDDLENGHEAAE